MIPELEQLNDIRLREDKTFEALADEIGLGHKSHLHRLLKCERNPNERTLYKIRVFLAKQAKRRKAS